MNQTTNGEERGVYLRLQNLLANGHNLLTKGAALPGQVQIWSGRVRSLLRDIFGVDSPVIAAWPGPESPFPREASLDTLAQRVAILENLLHALSGGVENALAGKPATEGRIFLGHGRSPVWRVLKDFLQDRLRLPWEEFNREETAGRATSDRLAEMLDSAAFAFLIMTAEDEHADESMHARENVIHEVGLFQGRLGPHRAIVMLERGCQAFSNIHGLTYIGFEPGRIESTFEQVRRVLEREHIMAGA